MHLGKGAGFDEGTQSLKVSQFYVLVKDSAVLSLAF